MEEKYEMPNWMKDSTITTISDEKKNILLKIYHASTEKSLNTPKEKLDFLIPIIKEAKENGLSFTKEELNLIVEAIKNNSSPEELNKINKIMK